MSVYPSDAPLPRFQISSASGFAFESGPQVVQAVFVAKVSNYQEVMDWVSQHSNYDRMLMFRSSHGEIVSFDANGIIRMSNYDVDFRSESFGKWNRLEFAEMINPAFTFDTPIYFCDVYVPLFSELPYHVWTDLQFKQTSNQGSSSSGLAIVAVPLILLFIGFLFIGLSGRGRKRGRR